MSVQVLPDQASLQRQARALGDPTRYDLFGYLARATEPVTVAELTAHFRLNHNAIRQHLATLCLAGLVIEDLAPPSGPGRRRLRYRTAPTAAAAWGGDNPYEQLALLLLELIGSDRPARQVGYDAGRRVAGRRRTGADPLDALVALVARQGFEPRLEHKTDHAELVLARCPFASAAAAAPATVCELHRGFAEGMADALGGVVVADLVARNPKRAGCRIRLAPDEGADQHV